MVGSRLLTISNKYKSFASLSPWPVAVLQSNRSGPGLTKLESNRSPLHEWKASVLTYLLPESTHVSRFKFQRDTAPYIAISNLDVGSRYIVDHFHQASRGWGLFIQAGKGLRSGHFRRCGDYSIAYDYQKIASFGSTKLRWSSPCLVAPAACWECEMWAMISYNYPVSRVGYDIVRAPPATYGFLHRQAGKKILMQTETEKSPRRLYYSPHTKKLCKVYITGFDEWLLAQLNTGEWSWLRRVFETLSCISIHSYFIFCILFLCCAGVAADGMRSNSRVDGTVYLELAWSYIWYKI